MATVQLKNVTKSFGRQEVIHDVSIDIENGQFVTLVGPSGCGKSTLLRMVAGLETISGGEISIAGQVVNAILPNERDIAMVFQNYALYPHMTVAENMGFSLEMKRSPTSVISERVHNAANILGLETLLGRYPRQLSGGQRQRVAMGRAIVRDPRVFLFDEPLSNLDAKLRVQMRIEIKALHQRLKTTTIYVTHDQIEAVTMADKIVLMNDGVVEQIGDPIELYDKPRNLFVGGFIGSPTMNFLAGTISKNDGHFLELGDAVRVPISPTAAEHGCALTFGVRPEHLEISDTGIPAKVIVVEQTGSETQIVADVSGREIIVLIRDRRVSFSAGQQIHLLPDMAHAHLFDTATGERI